MIKKLMMFSFAAIAVMGAWAEVYYDWHSNDDGVNTITLSGVYVDGVMPNPLVIPSEYDGRTVTRISLEESDIRKAKSIVLPNSLLVIEDNIFVDCMQLEKVDVVPGGKYKTRDNMLLSVDEKELVTVYGKASFSRTSLTIPDTVEIMGWWALFDSQKLKSVEIPKNVREIKGNPFVCCYALENISLHPANSAYKIENELLLTKDGKKLIATAGSYTKKRRDIVVPEGVEEICQLSLTSDMVDIRNVWMPKTLKVLHDALEWGGNGGKNGEYGAMENVIFQSQEKFEIVAGDCLFCDCDINNVWFAGPVPKNFYSEEWWHCGNVRKIHYTAEYKDEWEEALRKIGYANRGYVNRLEEFPKRPSYISISKNENRGCGSVTGSGSYSSGSKIALKATPNKGYVFAGWYEEEGFTLPCDSALVDYRNPNYSYVIGAEDKTFYARFEPIAADTNLCLTVNGIAITPEDTPLKSFTVGSATNLPVVIDSLSLPKVSVKGLPAGMKFTTKPIYKKGSKTEIDVPANTIYGTPTKPGVYKVSVSLTNTFIKKAVVNDFEIVVPNLKDDLISVEDAYGPYVPGVAYTNTIATAAGCTVSGLPAGMKWTAKDILDNKTKQVVVPANSAYGAPTKPGKYTVYFTKTVDKVKHSATATFVVGDFPVVNVVTVGSGTGKVTGVGAFAANKKVTLKATADTKDDANKGTKKSVFAGWYLDADGLSPVESTVDFRTVSLPYVMTAEPETTLYALFVTAEEDSDIMLYINDKEITVNANDNNFVAEGTTILPLEIASVSIPKATVSGLPAGMKYTDKALIVKATKTEDAYDVPANAIYGTPTKPGLYTVTVKLTNTTIKKAIEKKFTIEVPNLTAANGYFVDNLDNGIGKKRVLSVGITNIDDFLPSLKLKSNTAKLAVKGLPLGLKYDAKTGRITGVATKAGTYTVTLTVTDGKVKYVSTITIVVEALPDWVVGTFEGYFNECGWYNYSNYNKGYGSDWEAIGCFTVSITATGKVTGKFVKAHETQSFTAALVNVGQDRYEFFADYAVKDGNGWDERGEISFAVVYDEYENTHCARIEGELLGAENDNQDMPFEREIYGWRNLWSVKDIPLPKIAKATTYSKWYADEEYDIYGTLSLSFSAGRNTVVSSFAFDDLEDQKTLKITKCTSQLIITGYGEASGVFSAFLPVYMKHLDEPGDDEWIDLDFLIPMQIDTEGNVNIIWDDVKCAHDDWW